MSANPEALLEEGGEILTSLTPAEKAQLLSSPRRLYIMAFTQISEPPWDFDDARDYVGTRENRAPWHRLGRSDRKSSHVSLQQIHIPALREDGVLSPVNGPTVGPEAMPVNTEYEPGPTYDEVAEVYNAIAEYNSPDNQVGGPTGNSRSLSGIPVVGSVYDRVVSEGR